MPKFVPPQGPEFLRALLDPSIYPHECDDNIELIETHISWVLLTGRFAYKIKKPVNLGFLNFDTLAKRRHYCREEFRCNQNYAPELYCSVVAITKTRGGNYEINGVGEPIEYAVKMRQFDTEKQLDRLVEKRELEAGALRDFAADISARYSRTVTVAPTANYSQKLLALALDNIAAIESYAGNARFEAASRRLRCWTVDTFEQNRELLEMRLRDGWVRECHGDLHLSNLVLTERGVRAFDCIEFSAELREIDVVNDIAFLFMDCAVRGRNDLAYEFLDAYMESAADYEGLRLIPFFTVYRSLVRAKVAAARLEQHFDKSTDERLDQHLRWADATISRKAGHLIVMCGTSGSGKSYLAERLVPYLGAMRIRSDLMRKNIARLGRHESSNSGLYGGIYDAETSTTVYEHLARLSEALIASGEKLIVDASFLEDKRRFRFRQLAIQLGAKFSVVLCEAPVEVLEKRIVSRNMAGNDPSEATTEVLDQQLKNFRAPTKEPFLERVDTSKPIDIAGLAESIERVAPL